MGATAAITTLKGLRRKYVRSVGKPIVRRIDRFIADNSLVPVAPVLDSQWFPWVATLEANWHAIRQELETVLKQRDAIPRFQDISPDQYKISPDDKWKTYVLFGFGYRSEMNCAQCPRTAAVLETIPGMLTAFFSILGPQKHIPRHKGITKSVVRCHLGLIVPTQADQCFMDVSTVRCVWREGSAFVFDDTYPHEVFNNTDEERVVLLIDIERPMKRSAQLLTKAMMWLFCQTAYVKDARRNQQAWEERQRARQAAAGP